MGKVILELQVYGVIIGIIATILMAYTWSKRKELLYWFIAYIFTTIGLIVSAIVNAINPGGQDLWGNIFYVIGVIVIFIAILKEYYSTFLQGQIKSTSKKGITLAAVSVSPIVIGMEVFIVILCLTGAILLLRIFLVKKTPTHAFLCLILFAGLITLTITIFDTVGFENVRIFGQATTIFFNTILLVTAIVALIEKKIVSTSAALENVINTASEASLNVSNIATELAASASEVNASSEEISSTVQDVSQDAIAVKNDSNEMRNVMTLIKNVADQTNLLALNAAIEAGRAGEYGKGFAVVAEEVRKLADESKNAVENSAQKIDAIINKIQRTTASMEGISASTEEQTASMEEITATANRLGTLAEDLKNQLTNYKID
ncbi:MAG: hypothetical protein EU539_12395 [Promethearchaeota archaeon]|nr:MAG: hypothetical protein EU539_12395 [Candidatus Lokiarchaeota archaeon]